MTMLSSNYLRRTIYKILVDLPRYRITDKQRYRIATTCLLSFSLEENKMAHVKQRLTIEPTIPIIELNSPNKTEAAATLRQACIETGFFYLDNHSIPTSFLDEVFAQSKALFDLPLSEKINLSDKATNRGYTAYEEEVLDVSTQTQRGDTKEGYYIGRHIPKESPDYNPTKFRGPNVYPESSNSSLSHPDKFREIMDSYLNQLSEVGIQLVRLLALALHLPEHYFDASFEHHPLALLRLLHYSNEVSDPSKGIFSCGAHSDYGMITLLLVDSNPGLEIYYKDQWIPVPVPPKEGLFIVNLGDMLERWTNGLFRSTLHRVICKEGAQERYSIPFFYEPNFDTVVECLDGCWGKGNPKKYEKVTMGEFLTMKYKETHKDYDGANE